MESYLTEIKQLRIPRPKYEPSGNSPPRSDYYPLARPFTPPRDYQLTNESILSSHQRSYQEGGDDFRPSVHQKI
ncbi:uncharacterized protein LOC111685226 [Lucilia cuprina]|uniref:uncharacterized protein LOC111685226 n=1 Tax=Lucilia cuprina TaxID=7375 RepID=UPI001F05BE80|nr:uncharacterized protein LOC111685226 [Lucilia cuprina]